MIEVRPDEWRWTMFGYNTKYVGYANKFGYTTLSDISVVTYKSWLFINNRFVTGQFT